MTLRFLSVMMDITNYSKCNYLTVSLMSVVDFISVTAKSKEPYYAHHIPVAFNVMYSEKLV